MKKLTQLVALGAAITLTSGTSAFADETKSLTVLAALKPDAAVTANRESDAADRMRVAQRLVMLTQKVAATSCALTSDVAPEDSYYQFQQSVYEVDLLLDGLVNGNTALNLLRPEQNTRIQKDVHAFWSSWNETRKVAEAVLENRTDVDSARMIDAQSATLLAKANVIASDIMGVYANPNEVTQSDAMLISLAGRQNMLTQKIASTACHAWAGNKTEQQLTELKQSMEIFEGSVNALRHGMPSLGIKAAPTKTIAADLDDIMQTWKDARGNLDALLEGESLNATQKGEVFEDFTEDLKKSTGLTDHYKQYVKDRHS